MKRKAQGFGKVLPGTCAMSHSWRYYRNGLSCKQHLKSCVKTPSKERQSAEYNGVQMVSKRAFGSYITINPLSSSIAERKRGWWKLPFPHRIRERSAVICIQTNELHEYRFLAWEVNFNCPIQEILAKSRLLLGRLLLVMGYCSTCNRNAHSDFWNPRLVGLVLVFFFFFWSFISECCCLSAKPLLCQSPSASLRFVSLEGSQQAVGSRAPVSTDIWSWAFLSAQP